MLRWAYALEIGEVIPVHGQNVIELPEILNANLTTAQATEIIPPLCSSILRPLIWWLTIVIIMGASGVNHDPIVQAGGFDHLPEYALGCGRTTNIAHTDE